MSSQENLQGAAFETGEERELSSLPDMMVGRDSLFVTGARMRREAAALTETIGPFAAWRCVVTNAGWW
jgi:hypothetical protein